MRRFLVALALGGALCVALPPAPVLALGWFNEHGALQKREDVRDTPEIDPGAAQSAVALVVVGLLVLVDRRRRRR